MTFRSRVSAEFWEVSSDYRVLGYQQGDEMFWFWIGPHDEYERLING